MFKSFRVQLTAWFLGLSFIVYLACAAIGAFHFYSNLSHSLDEQMRVVMSQIGHAIDLNGGAPVFRDWLRVVETHPARSLVSIQLFNSSGKLLEHYGPPGIPKLLLDVQEFTENGSTMRIKQTPLSYEGKVIGYLQLQLPTKERQELTKEFILTMGSIAPFLLLGLGTCAYFVSGMAVAPIERSVRTLQQFVADAGHELNTPTSIIQARSQSLERKLEKKNLFEEDVKIISASAERLGHIIQNLMILAEMDGRKAKASNRSRVDVKATLEELLQQFSERFSERAITLSTSEMSEAEILADKQSLVCIISNLLENAQKYTEPGGKVFVSCKTESGSVQLSVEDSGIGIPEECLPHIFERFYRVDKSRSRSSGGSGLGLSIVKALVESFDGKIMVESHENRGSKFNVTFPALKQLSHAR